IMHNVKSGFEAGFILPKKVASILKAVLSKDAGNIEIKFDSDKACIKTDDIVMHFSLIEGRYPNYNGVIPADNPFKSVTDRQALASALKRVSVFCNQSSGLVKLELSQNTLKLTGQDYEFATNAIEYQNCEYSGQNIHIGFSCQFLIEILNILDSESVSIELADPSRPGIIKPVPASEDEEILMLLMPMRVEE
ncbi:MAG: DNA polymerase III subunit beta, partial [Bacteroidaceae bacterium]|nr:DNA polymerase III subunit beta [Bacteroidaceae bacterium]